VVRKKLPILKKLLNKRQRKKFINPFIEKGKLLFEKTKLFFQQTSQNLSKSFDKKKIKKKIKKLITSVSKKLGTTWEKGRVYFQAENLRKVWPVLAILAILLMIAGIFIFARLENRKPVISYHKIAKTSTIAKSATVSSKIDENAEFTRKGFCLSVPAFYYHHIEPADLAAKEGHASLNIDVGAFEAQMKYFVDHGYNTITAEELPASLAAHRGIGGKPILITLDDGYVDSYTYAYPIAKKYGIKLNLFIITGLLGGPDYLTWSQLQEMVGSGLVFAYDHTVSHYSLPSGNVEKIKSEIVGAKEALEENLGVNVRILAYPYGSYDQKVINVVQETGFLGAYGTSSSFLQCESSIYSLKRTRASGSLPSAYGL